jgi:hypothetical protein
MNLLTNRSIQFKIVLWLIIIFNVWHLTLIRIWSPATLYQSLHTGEKIVERFKSYDPNLEISSASYDGQFTYAMLYDPLLIHRTNLDVFDNPPYRYSRILFPFLAYIVSLGQHRLFGIAMFEVSVGAYFVGGIFVWLLARREKWTPAVILGYFSLSGLVFTTFWNLTEPLALCLCIVALYMFSINRRLLCMILLCASILAREVSILVLLAIYLYELHQRKIKVFRALSEMSAIMLPWLIWKVYIFARISSNFPNYPSWAPQVPGWGRFALPFTAMWIETKFGWTHLTTHMDIKRTCSIVFLSAPLILWIMLTFIKRRKSLWSFLAVTQAFFLIIIRGDLWNYYAGSVRIVIALFLFTIFWCADELVSE